MYPHPPTTSLASVLPESRAKIPDYPTYLLVEERPGRPSVGLRQRLGDFFIETGLRLKGQALSDQEAASILRSHP